MIEEFRFGEANVNGVLVVTFWVDECFEGGVGFWPLLIKAKSWVWEESRCYLICSPIVILVLLLL